MSVYELTAKELFAWYTNGENAAEILSQGRAEIAARLQKEERLAEKDAFTRQTGFWRTPRRWRVGPRRQPRRIRLTIENKADHQEIEG